VANAALPEYLNPVLAPDVERASEALAPRGVPRPYSPVVTATVLAQLAQRAYQWGRDDAVRELLTTAQAAAQLGVSEQRVRQLAQARGVGWQISRGVWLFRPEDLARMQDRTPGRPPRPRGA